MDDLRKKVTQWKENESGQKRDRMEKETGQRHTRADQANAGLEKNRGGELKSLKLTTTATGTGSLRFITDFLHLDPMMTNSRLV